MRRLSMRVLLVAGSFGAGAAEAQDTARSSIFPINAYTTGNQSVPNIVSQPNGEFAVVWESAGQEPGQYVGTGVFARRFDENGTPLADEFQVNEYTTMDQ